MTIGRPSKIDDILAMADELTEMAKNGAGKCEMYVKMGITKKTASRYLDENSPYYSSNFCHLIDGLVTLSQAHWEKLGQQGIHDKDFNAAVYNKQMAGRFKDDWGNSIQTDVNAKVISNSPPRDISTLVFGMLTAEQIQQISTQIEGQQDGTLLQAES